MPLPLVASGVVVATAVAAWVLARGVGSALMIPQPGGIAAVLERDPAYPLPEAPVRALPPLEESDAVVRASLARVGGMHALLPLLAPQGLVRRVVAIVHDARRHALPARLYQATPAIGPEEAREARSVLGAADFARYDPYVRGLEAVDTEALVAVYVRLYPLFQEAYRAHAGDGRHFNDALVEVIDHLLALQLPTTPLVVLQRGALRVYEDPGLEALSGGRKLLLRLGLDNAARVRAVLREARSRLALQPAGGAQSPRE